MKQIGQGRTADIFEDQKEKILKLYKKGFPEEAIHQEFLVSKFVYSLGVNTPQPFELTQIDDRQGIIFQRISGFSLLHIMTKSPWSIKKHARTLATLHKKLHSHHADGILRQQKMVFSHNINEAPFLTEEEKKKIINYLDELPNDNKLCHGDFHPDNVLVSEESWIIDWMTGMCGNPAGDVARTVILFSLGTLPEGTPRIIKAVVHFLRGRMKKGYIRHYLKLSKRDYADIDRWILPVAASRLIEWIPQEEKDKLLLVIRERLREIP